GQEDERRGVGRLGGEGQVEQDERVGVEAQGGGGDVEGDPAHDEDGLSDEEAGRPERPGDGLGKPAEGLGVVVQADTPAQPGGGEVGAPLHWWVLQPTGSVRSRTSSTVTAPRRKPEASQTGRARRL